MLEKLEDLEFAEGLILLSQTITDARQKFEAFQEQADGVGLNVNASKTKEMRIRPNAGDAMCRGKALEQVTVFTYLGSIVTITEDREEDVEARCREAQVVFYMLRPVWRSLYISLWTKLRIFNSNVKSVLLYGSETWQLTETIINKLQAFINRRLRYILGEKYQMMTCGSTPSKGGWKSPSDVGNGNGSATHSGNLLLTSQGSPLSGTLKELAEERETEKVTEKDHQANGPHKIESAGERLWRPYAPDGVELASISHAGDY